MIKNGELKDGLKVISPDDLIENLREGHICISSRLYYKEIEKQLLGLSIPMEKVFNFGEMTDILWDKQYFDLPELYHVENESFVDAGCYDGKTSLNFIKWAGNKYQHIYAFEADPCNTSKIDRIFLKPNFNGKVDIISKGVWNEIITLKFNSMSESTSQIDGTGNIEISVTTLDKVFDKKEITFIKMDIEGAELSALKGSKNIISEQKPKLAISLYHKQKDIFDIPNLLLQYNPDYKFYLRHYSFVAYETVLYAL